MSPRKDEVWSDVERDAMVEHAKEQKAAARRASRANKAQEDENDLLAKIAEMPEQDRALAERIHAIVKECAPNLAPKTWYGMPAYANSEGKVVCFFQAAQKFGSRYASFGFNDSARLDDGSLWPVAFAITALGPAEEEKIIALVKKAAG